MSRTRRRAHHVVGLLHRSHQRKARLPAPVKLAPVAPPVEIIEIPRIGHVLQHVKLVNRLTRDNAVQPKLGGGGNQFAFHVAPAECKRGMDALYAHAEKLAVDHVVADRCGRNFAPARPREQRRRRFRVVAAEHVAADRRPVPRISRPIERAGIERMPAPHGHRRQEACIVGARRHAIGRDQVQHGRVVGTFLRPCGADVRFGRASGITHDFRHAVVGRRAVALRRLVGGPKADKRPHDRQPFLKRDDARHGRLVRLARRRQMQQVQLADQVERHALPARGHQRRRVAGVLDTVLVADREENVRHHQEHHQQPRKDEREDEDDLPRSGGAPVHQSIQSG